MITSEEMSTMSSPLTSLTSLDDANSDQSSYPDTVERKDDTHQVAEVWNTKLLFSGMR